MKYFLWGSLATSSLLVATAFWRYWRVTHDKLFVYFSVGFLLMAVQWTVSALAGTRSEGLPYALLLRLAAFASIIVGIVVKNRALKPS